MGLQNGELLMTTLKEMAFYQPAYHTKAHGKHL